MTSLYQEQQKGQGQSLLVLNTLSDYLPKFTQAIEGLAVVEAKAYKEDGGHFRAHTGGRDIVNSLSQKYIGRKNRL